MRKREVLKGCILVTSVARFDKCLASAVAVFLLSGMINFIDSHVFLLACGSASPAVGY